MTVRSDSQLELKIRSIVRPEAHQRIEKQIPIVAKPWWLPLKIRIADDAETVVKEYNEVCVT